MTTTGVFNKNRCFYDLLFIGLFILCTARAGAQQRTIPVAQWNFNEGAGERTIEQISNTPLQIRGAAWVKQNEGFALRFDGIDDYIDAGKLPAFDLQGPMSLELWVHPDQPARGEPGIFGKWFESFALTYYRGSCWFYIGSGANKVHAPLPVGEWSHIVAIYDGTELRLHINGQKAHRNTSTFEAAPAGEHLYFGAIAPNAAAAKRHFAGMIASARLYDQPLNWKEVADRYNAEADRYENQPIDTSQFDTIGLQLFPYPERKELVVRINTALITLPRDQLRVQLELAGEAGVQAAVPLSDTADTTEVILTPSSTTDDALLCRATLMINDEQISRSEADAVWMKAREAIAHTDTYRAPPLPERIRPPKYTCVIDTTGLITLTIGAETYHISSHFSYPRGGFNTFGDSQATPEPPEPAWSVSPSGNDAYTITGAGAYYRIERKLTLTPTRIEVEDTFANTTDEVIGIMLEHRLEGEAGALPTINDNPTVFLAGQAGGAGLVALDDIFFLRAENRLAGKSPALMDTHLGIPPGKSHSTQWAIYPMASTDYFDFINQIRADENIHGHVPGAFAFTTSWEPPEPKVVKDKALAFYSWASLTRVLHDPTLSLEGWEFTDYPLLCDQLRTWIAQTRSANPELQTTFHVAHSLFATNEPEALFPDSLARDAAGNTLCYGGNSIDYYTRYFSPELVQDGWRWWIYYPTLENSFGKRMLASAEYMIRNLGATSVWADGYISGYVRGLYTYDHWDNVSVSIDPETKTITRKKALVPHVAMPVLKAVAQLYTDAGGYLITNGNPGPLSFNRMPVISSCETSGGDQQPIAKLHLASTITPLGNPVSIKTFQHCYDDILGKLDHGALYFWYGEGETVTEPTLVSAMYPITFESIHPGTVRGKERIVTKVSGVYGWPDATALHRIHFFDGRGRKRPHTFITTLDEQGIRSEITLGIAESAVIEKLPVRLDTEVPQNIQVLNYDADQLEIITSLAPNQVQYIKLPNSSHGEVTLKVNTEGILSISAH